MSTLSSIIQGAIGYTAVNKAGDTMTGVLTIANTTPSTSNSTGSLVVTGGLGISGNVYSTGYVVGDGSLLTGLPQGYTNSNVASYLLVYGGNVAANVITSNTISNTGNTSTNILLANTAYITGNVGIGTNSPVAPLSVYNASVPEIRLTNSTTGNVGSVGLTLQQNGANSYAWNYSNGFLSLGSNNGERVRIAANGDVNMTNSLSVTTSLSVGGTAVSTTAGEIRATNAITAFYSDKRLKSNFEPINNPLDKVDRLTGMTYTQNGLAEQFGYKDYSRQVGLIAQDVQSVLPEAVKIAPFDMNENGNSKSGENYLTVQYEKLVPLLVEAIKELRQEIKTLKGE